MRHYSSIILNTLNRLIIILWISWCSIQLIAAQQAPNISEKPVIELDFSIDGGFYDHEIDIELFSNGTRIYYTLDGTMPNRRDGIR